MVKPDILKGFTDQLRSVTTLGEPNLSCALCTTFSSEIQQGLLNTTFTLNSVDIN